MQFKIYKRFKKQFLESIQEISHNMAFLKKILTFLFLILVSLLLSTGCASSKKNPYYEKRMKASRTNTNQLGRNRYYFSKDYQKKLGKSYKRK
jgi:phosphoglycerol transferase MdoB-like AlkP superfamily enzyme